MEDQKILYVDIVCSISNHTRSLNNHLNNNHYDTVIFGKLFYVYDLEKIELPIFCKNIIIKDTPTDNNEMLSNFLNKLKTPFGCQIITTSQILYEYNDINFCLNKHIIPYFIKDILHIEKYELYELDKDLQLSKVQRNLN